MKQLEEANPCVELWFILGEDLVESLNRWYNGSRLIEEVRFAIAVQPSFDFTAIEKAKLPKQHKTFLIDVDTRSTEQRTLIR